jgi:hypothetical protein
MGTYKYDMKFIVESMGVYDTFQTYIYIDDFDCLFVHSS